MAKAINGPQKGKKLKSIPLSHTSWQDWSIKHADSLVLSISTGYKRDYSQSPYGGYENSDQIFLSVSASDERFQKKEWVLGIKSGDTYKAYPFSELMETPSPIKDGISGYIIEIIFDKESNSAWAHDGQGKEIHTVMAYWFAWYTFHPHTKVFRAP